MEQENAKEKIEVEIESTERKTLPVPKKFKKKSKSPLTLLHISGDKFVGKMYINGVTISITLNHAVMERRECITIYPADSLNYMMLRQILQFAEKKNRNEEEEYTFKWGCIFVASLLMTDFAAGDLTHQFNLYDMHQKHLLKEGDKQIAAMKDDPEANRVDLNAVQDILEQCTKEEEKTSEI